MIPLTTREIACYKDSGGKAVGNAGPALGPADSEQGKGRRLKVRTLRYKGRFENAEG